MAKRSLEAKNLRASKMLKRMMRHSGDVSEGTGSKLIAQRTILKRTVSFYNNGLRVIEGEEISEEDQYNSEVLRLAHASILMNAPVGDKRMCYVDATKNPVEVWFYNQRAEHFIDKVKEMVRTGQISEEVILDQPLQHTKDLKNERNVKLFGR